MTDPEEVIKLAANSLGWVTFYEILKRLKGKNGGVGELRSEDVLA